MKRPLALASVLYISGAFLGISLGIYALIFVLFSLILAVAVKFILTGFERQRLKAFCAVLVLAASFALGLLSSFAAIKDDVADMYDLYGNDVLFCGDVVYIWDDLKCVTVETKWMEGQSGRKNISKKIEVMLSESFEGDIKDFVTVKGTLYKYPQSRFYGDMDMRLYKAGSGLKGVVYNGDIKIYYSNKRAVDLTAMGYYGRKFIDEKIDGVMEGQKAAIMKAILIGNKQHLATQVSENLKLSGLAHIAAVSGMHFSIMLSCIGALVMFSGRKRSLIAVCLIAASLAYCVLVGEQASVLRAALMLIYSLIISNMRLRRDALTALAFSTALLCVYNPYLTHNVSFQLSCLATLGIILFNGKFGKTAFEITLTVLIVITPVSAWYFNMFGIAALFANVIIGPLMLVALPLGYLVCFLPFLHYAADIVSQAVLTTSEVFARVDFLNYKSASPSAAAMTAYGFAVAALYFFLSKSKRKQAIAAALVSVVLASSIFINLQIYKDCTKVSFVNLGAGHSIHIQTAGGYNALVDCGRSELIVSYLDKKGIDKIDMVFITAYTQNSIGGLNELLKAESGKQVKRVYMPETDRVFNSAYMEDLKIALEKTQVVYYNEGSVKFGEVKINILYNPVSYDNSATTATVKINCFNTSILAGTANSGFVSEGSAKSDIIYIAEAKNLVQVKEIADASGAEKIVVASNENLPDKLMLSLKNYPYITNVCGTSDFYISEKGIKKIKTLRPLQPQY